MFRDELPKQLDHGTSESTEFLCQHDLVPSKVIDLRATKVQAPIANKP